MNRRQTARFGLVIAALFAAWMVGSLAPSAAQDGTPTVTKLFEETSYYLKDITFVDTATGWAVGDVHWDQAGRRYVSTIIHTTDGGVTWTPQATDTTALLNAVAFVDAATGWAVGAEGVILHTADGGQTWTRQPVDTDAEFRGVAFADASHGWAVTTLPTTYDDFFEEYTDWDAAVWHTADGGQSWERQALPDTASILHGVAFADAQTGWAVGAKRAGEDKYGKLEHAGVVFGTRDGGVTWTEQYSQAERTYTKVDFVDASHGWVVGFPTSSGGDERTVLHTTDGGQSWEIQEPGDIFSPLWDVHFIDQNRGYIAGANYIGAWGPPVKRTFDGGATWEDVKMEEGNPLSVEGIYAIEVMGDRVIAVGDHDYITTTDRAWESPERDGSGMPCLNLACLFEQHYINPHYIFHGAYFVDENQGWVVGSKTFDVTHWGQVILHTADGGQTWDTQYEHSTDPDDLGYGLFSVHRLDDVHFTDALSGWAVGSTEMSYGNGWEHSGALLHTSDGGLTWQDIAGPLYEDSQREFFALDVVDGQNAWALVARYTSQPAAPATVALAHTADGTTWNWVDSGVEGSLSIGFALVQGDVDFADAQHGWAVGGLGSVVSTSDGGATWTQQTLNCGWPSCPIRLFAVAMINAQTGWIGGEGLFHTTNGGAEWAKLELELGGDVRALQFPDAQHGWLATDRGAVMRTTDGGATWIAVDTGTFSALNGMHFLAPDMGWIVGDYGVILKIGE